jgi:hypothetical protein
MKNTFGLFLATASLMLFAATARAEFYINEIFFDPGGNGSDTRDEYIELRGPAGISLSNHYLIFVENEDDESGLGQAGVIDNIFNLSAFSMGTNGFLTIRQKGNFYDPPAPGTTNLVNTSTGPNSIGFGSGVGSSTVGAEDSPDGDSPPEYGRIENGGFTAMLFRADAWGAELENSPVAPFVGMDLDQGNDGLDPLEASVNDWRQSWTFLDSLGVHEADETQYGRLYGQVNYGPQPGFLPPGWTPNIEPGAEFTFVGYEIEYVGRWGNSTGQSLDDWHISNFTDRQNAGSSGVSAIGGPDWRQSCIDTAGCHPGNPGFPNSPPPQPPGGVESNKGVPYGTKLANTLGAPNYITGDFNKDGTVDAADYVLWRKTLNQTGTESNHPNADANHDFLVDADDYSAWAAHFNSPSGNNSGSGGNASVAPSTVPEPATWMLAALATLLWSRRFRNGSRCLAEV